MQLLSRITDRIDSTDTDTKQNTSLSAETAHYILENTRRRHIIRHLYNLDSDQTTVADIADEIAATTDIPRQNIYIGIYQDHAPTLAEHGIIDYDQDRGTIKTTPALDSVWNAHHDFANTLD